MASSAPAATKSSFPAVVDEATRVLVLGSLPGEVSLSHAQYYAHPRNQFWSLMEAVVGVELAGSPYQVRLAVLLSAGVGLWDVIRSANRVGSLDANIRDHRPNTLRELVATLPALRAVGFNGGKASDIGRKQLAADGGPALITLPSSSPAHAIPFDRKRAEWLQLKAFLDSAQSAR
jgi:hypoxanthine-DNA glycosylase